MPDYTSILRRSISALPDSSPEMREAVYQRARSALGRQLTAVEPPLSAREIESQHQELEDAIARLEADYAPAEPLQPVSALPEAIMPPVRRDENLGRAQAMDTDAPGADDDLPDERSDDEEDDEDYEEERRPLRGRLMVGGLLIALVIAGLGVVGYTQRDALLASSGSGDEQQGTDIEAGADDPPIRVVTPVPQSVDAAPAVASETGPDKRLDRLTNGPEPAPSPAEAVPAEVVAAVPEAAPPPDAPVPAPSPAESPPGENVAAVEPAPPTPAAPPAGADQPGQAIVAQRAIYYFQGTEGQPGRAAEGSVTWAEIARENGPAVQATLRMTDQDVVTTVTISKNNDPNLPASHLVEVQFTGSLAPSPIQRVPALVLKQTEQARGQPLTGAAVPVTADLFWIALSDEADQTARNLQLLREGSWFDIPILFNDGTRALLTFEKGIPGDRIFETVLAAWTPT